MAKVFVQPRKARPFWFGHPWVFSGAVDRVKGRVQDGDVVELCDSEGRLIGRGFYNEKSQIRVRLTSLAFEGPLDEAFLLRRLDSAIALRRDVLKLDATTNAYRVVHAEGDGLPGLVVDRAGDYLVLQVSALGIAPFTPKFVERLVERFRPKGVLERTSRVGLEEEGLQREDGVLYGEAPTSPVRVVENGVAYFADLAAGQKTGWYCDQRDNRRFVASLSEGKTVLDAFSYVGGFGLAAAKAGASAVRCLDSSEGALALLRRGAEENGVADRVASEEINVLRALDHDAKEGRTYDVVVVDPPKLVHRRVDREKGLRLYAEINRKAIAVVRDEGVLVTCSCSRHVEETDFEDAVASAAKDAYARLQLVHRGGQGGDHPLTLPHAESRYLKTHVYRVRRTSAEAIALYATPYEPAGFRAPDAAGDASDTAGSTDAGESSDAGRSTKPVVDEAPPRRPRESDRRSAPDAEEPRRPRDPRRGGGGSGGGESWGSPSSDW
jgi:23S rRNA (cytosine1962-C5)-methyltransferase